MQTKRLRRLVLAWAILAALLLGGMAVPSAGVEPAASGAPYQEFLYQETIAIKYRERQQGHPYTLLFIHGFGAGSHYWQELEEHFAPAYNTVALDLKGFGHSDKPRDGKYSIRDQAEMVAAFIEAKDLSQVILVGHSMGGAVALCTHFRLGPKRVKGMILLDNASYGQMLPDFIRLLKSPVLGRLGPALLPDRLLMKNVLKKVYYNQGYITEKTLRPYLGYLKTPGAHYALRQTAMQLIPDNVDEIIEKTVNLDIPLLVIWGEYDRVLPLGSGQRLHEDVKGSEFVIIPDSGHNPHEEQAARTIQAMEDFLQRRLGAGPGRGGPPPDS